MLYFRYLMVMKFRNRVEKIECEILILTFFIEDEIQCILF
jgi:hypothetical protein